MYYCRIIYMLNMAGVMSQLCVILLYASLACYNLQIPFKPSPKYVVMYVCSVTHIVNLWCEHSAQSHRVSKSNLSS